MAATAAATSAAIVASAGVPPRRSGASLAHSPECCPCPQALLDSPIRRPLRKSAPRPCFSPHHGGGLVARACTLLLLFGWPGLPVAASTTSSAYVSSWPNPIDGYTHGDTDGALPEKEAVDRDFRYYYRVAALELLLVYHGFRKCETTSVDPGSLEELIDALKAFLRNKNLPDDILRLGPDFWNQLIVPVKIGDDNSAVLALRWLVTATTEAARPPMWDAASVNRHRCRAIFDHELEADLLARPGIPVSATEQEIRLSGVQPDTWKTLLNLQEVRESSGCKSRAFVVRVFSVAWVVTWCAIAATFAITHTDGWGHVGSIVLESDTDGRIEKQASPWQAKSFSLDSLIAYINNMQVPRFCRPTAVLFAMMVSHNLAVLGVWSFPLDLIAQLFAGLVFTGGAIVAVRLASVYSPKADGRMPLPKRLLQVGAFALSNMVIYVSMLAIPNRQRMWWAALLAFMMVFWAAVTAGITDPHQRVMRGGLLLVMCIVAAALPSSIIIGASMVTVENGIWFTAFVPSLLLLLTVVSEYLGRLVVQHCEYTVETQWLLAAVFRLCIELVRFDTALAVLLLTLFTKSTFAFVILHLGQTFIFEVLLRQSIPKLWGCLSKRRGMNETDDDLSVSGTHLPLGDGDESTPFTAAEIVLRVDVDPWAYRSRAVMGPIEGVLFLTHLCQLLFIGMPVGVGHGAWMGGLVIIAFASIAREALAYAVAAHTGMILPKMPWSKLPGHLIALMIGVGMVMSTFAQVSFFWLMYAHHWAACFIGGKKDGSVETSADTEVAGAVVMAIIGSIVLGMDVCSFFSWAEWMAKVRLRQLGRMAAMQGANKQIKVVVSDGSRDDSGNIYNNVSGATIGTSGVGSEPSRQASKSKNLYVPNAADHRSSNAARDAQDLMSQTWDQTLNSLWEPEKRETETPLLQERPVSAPVESATASRRLGVAEVETFEPHTELHSRPKALDIDDEWAGAQRLPSRDLHLRLSEELLEKVAPQELEHLKESQEPEPQEQPDVFRGETDKHKELLEQVLSEMPADTSPNGGHPSIIVTSAPISPIMRDSPEKNLVANPELLEAVRSSNYAESVVSDLPDSGWSLHDNDMKELLGDQSISNLDVTGLRSPPLTEEDEGEAAGLRNAADAGEDERQPSRPSVALKNETVARLLFGMDKSDNLDDIIDAALQSKSNFLDDCADYQDAACKEKKDDQALRASGSADPAYESCSTMPPPTADTATASAFNRTTSVSGIAEGGTDDSALTAGETRPQSAENVVDAPLENESEQQSEGDHLLDLQALASATDSADDPEVPEATDAILASSSAEAPPDEPTSPLSPDAAVADGAAAAAALEEQLREAERIERENAAAAEELARQERLAAEEARKIAEELERIEAERLAREALIQETLNNLQEAMRSRSREDLERRLEEATAVGGIAGEKLDEAQRVLNDLIVEENRLQASLFLEKACLGQNIDKLRLAIGRAKEARADEGLIEAAVQRLDELLAEVARREAASKKLREVLAKQTGPEDSLASIIDMLTKALQEAHTSGVASSEREAGNQRLQVLMTQKRREDAEKAMMEALNAHDVVQVQAAIDEAKMAQVDPKEISAAERALEDLKEEIELANNKEKLLKRRIEHAMEAKTLAEMAESSMEVEKMLGEHGVIHALNAGIADAKKTRMVRRGGILAKAEAVLPEITADLKRILADKQANEKKLATERLRSDMELAKRTKPTTQLVLAALREAIAAAQVYRAETKDAEACLAALTAEHERAVQVAQETLDRALTSKDAEAIRGALEQCRAMLLSDAISRAMSQIRGIITEDIAVAYEVDRKEDRMKMVVQMEMLVGLLRVNGDKQLRQLHNSLQDLKGALRVFCRIRPMNKREIQRNDTIATEVVDDYTVSVQRNERNHEVSRSTAAAAGRSEIYTYDAVFGPSSTQAEVFSEVRSLVQSAFDGYSVAIFTYGQTGAGKTWTLYGSGQEPGISPRTCEVIFSTVARDADKYNIELKASMVELYQAELRDLLWLGKDAPQLQMRNYRHSDGTPSVRLEGTTLIDVRSASDLARVVAQGLNARKVRATHMNADSSRSHLLLMINVEIADRASNRTRSGKITIVDLAGSERLAKSGATGDAAREAIEINKSLTALGDVMMAFTSKAKMIPYRNHKLTQLMQDSLGGSAKTLMFVNVSPASSNTEETVQSLKYASRARCIENDVHVNSSSRSQAPTPMTQRSTMTRRSPLH